MMNNSYYFRVNKALFLFLGIFCNYCLCQVKNIKILAIDENNSYNKTLGLSPKYDIKYYNKDKTYDTVSIKNNKYIFIKKTEITNTFPRPYNFILELQKNQSYMPTEGFYIENENKKIIFNSVDGKTTDTNENIELKKDRLLFKKYMKDILYQKRQIDSVRYFKDNNNINNIKEAKDSLDIKYNYLKIQERKMMLNYSKKNSNSITLFWKIVEKIETEGYDELYEKAYKNLSKKIQISSPGKILYQQFIESKKFKKGNLFTFKINESDIKVSKKYTLIDFWFSYCSPCLEEIPMYKKLYEKYKDKNFEIISISTDRTQDIGNWKKVIERNNINWQNLLDENGQESKKININKFPTNFLLDSEGKIIKKDISQEELGKFLEENLK